MTSQTTHPPSVAVLVLNWESWHLTARCLASLDTVCWPNSAVVVCDNGSRDGSLEKAQAWAANPTPNASRRPQPTHPGRETSDPVTARRTVLSTGQNLGFAAGTNEALRVALETGFDFAWLLNNDAVALPGSLAALVHAAQADPRIGAVGSMIYDLHWPHRLQTWGGGTINFATGTGRNARRPPRKGRVDFITGASMLLRAQTLREVGLFDPGFFLYWEDADLCLRMRKRGWRLAVAERSIVLHELSATTAKSPTGLDRHYTASSIRMYRKHAPAPALTSAVAIGGRLIKRADPRRWPQFAAMLSSAIRAWSQPL